MFIWFWLGDERKTWLPVWCVSDSHQPIWREAVMIHRSFLGLSYLRIMTSLLTLAVKWMTRRGHSQTWWVFWDLIVVRGVWNRDWHGCGYGSASGEELLGVYWDIRQCVKRWVWNYCWACSVIRAKAGIKLLCVPSSLRNRWLPKTIRPRKA